MSTGQDPSAQPPTSGNSPFPDSAAPASGSSASQSPGNGPDAESAEPARPAPSPGDQDLPWKATAERRDLWGPVDKPLEGPVRSPGSGAVGRPRRSPWLRIGLPLLLGGLVFAAVVVVGLGAALAGPLLVLAAAAGFGVVAVGGTGVALGLARGGGAEPPVLGASVPESTRAMLERILAADVTTRERVAAERPRASVPAAVQLLDDVETLLSRIDALVRTEQLQSQRPSSGEVTMLEGIAVRYVPELVDSASDTIGFLQTFAGSAREEALENLVSIDAQLHVLAEGVERIESDLVGGVSHSLEVHSEFLRTRFADQHLNPLLDL